MRGYVLCATLCVAVSAGHSAQAMTCDSGTETAETHVFNRNGADIVGARHLELTRSFTDSGKLKIHICSADLRVRARSGLDQLRLVIDLGAQPGGHPLIDYVQRLQIQSDSGAIELRLPSEAHATVTLEVPMSAGSETEIDLGTGNLDLNTMRAAGDRTINVGMGNVTLAMGGDRSYSNLALNIGMGTLHDHRPGGRSGHLVVSRTESGSGSGQLEINIGMGTLDIRE